VVLYTDGVIEATDSNADIFGFQRLQELLQTVGYLKPRSLMARILADVRNWTHSHYQDDDITMVLLRRRLKHLGEELHSATADVVGPLTATEIWHALGITDQLDNSDTWTAHLRPLSELVSRQFGRGMARELQGQLRPIIDEYRLLSAGPQEAQG
jgi:phosphoserine phosphatase RsbU/P